MPDNINLNEITSQIVNARLQPVLKLSEKAKLNESSNKEAIDELRYLLEEVAEALDEAINKARDAARFASEIGGEVDRVVAGQIESYLIGHLESFTSNSHQPGSVASLTSFLDDELGTEEEEEELPPVEAEPKIGEGKLAEGTKSSNADKDQESFITQKKYGKLKRGQVIKYYGKDWKVVEADEYPIGTPGYWIKQVIK